MVIAPRAPVEMQPEVEEKLNRIVDGSARPEYVILNSELAVRDSRRLHRSIAPAATA
jgi:hypothetical protein